MVNTLAQYCDIGGAGRDKIWCINLFQDNDDDQVVVVWNEVLPIIKDPVVLDSPIEYIFV